MEIKNGSIEQKLLKSFTQFKRGEWHRRNIAGHKPSEINVLMCIKHSAKHGSLEMKVSDISKLLRVTSPTVTQLIKGMEEKGLVERNSDPLDRRAVRIKLTTKGEKVAKKAEQAFKASLQGLVEFLGEEQSIQLAELLSQVFIYFNEKDRFLNQEIGNGVD